MLTRRELVGRGMALAAGTTIFARLAEDEAFGVSTAPRWSLGAFVNPANKRLTFAEALGATARLESALGRRFAISSTFVAWEEPFPNEGHALDRNAGRTPLIAWEGLPDPSAISSGRWDALLLERARACREHGSRIYLRWSPEFNGEWNPSYGQTSSFVAAWRHLVGTFRSAGATNVRWVWCPFAVQGRRRPAEQWEGYYPGDRFVDWVGMDGYNWGTTRSWSRWQSFSEIFAPLYADYAQRKPLLICEVASAERGGDKAAWIRNMGADLASRFPKVEAVVWFHANKETDWRMNSSRESLRAFRSIV